MLFDLSKLRKPTPSCHAAQQEFAKRTLVESKHPYLRIRPNAYFFDLLGLFGLYPEFGSNMAGSSP
jgi:hypothetical protein